MLKLMYITNDENVAKIADKHGVDRIFVDLEQIGKQERQGGMDTEGPGVYCQQRIQIPVPGCTRNEKRPACGHIPQRGANKHACY